MINPKDVNPLELPSVPLSERSKLPQVPCIYFAIDSQGAVQYIGMTKNPRRRLNNHHRTAEMIHSDVVKISYLFCDGELLPAVESALILWFDPPLNRRKLPFVERSGPLGKTYGVRIHKSLEPFLLELAAEAGMTPAQWMSIVTEAEIERSRGAANG